MADVKLSAPPGGAPITIRPQRFAAAEVKRGKFGDDLINAVSASPAAGDAHAR